jgi:hypothetical protein
MIRDKGRRVGFDQVRSLRLENFLSQTKGEPELSLLPRLEVG